jgi:hypothetical protein
VDIETPTVRVGIVSSRRIALYIAAGVVGFAVGFTAIIVPFGWNRLFTALAIGLLLGGAIAGWLLSQDGIILDDDAVAIRTPWRRSKIAWERISGIHARRIEPTEADETEKWLFEMQFAGSTETLALLEIPAVTSAWANPYEHRSREQLKAVFDISRAKALPVAVPASIAQPLKEHWHLEAPIY